jgi:hypothetical protein
MTNWIPGQARNDEVFGDSAGRRPWHRPAESAKDRNAALRAEEYDRRTSSALRKPPGETDVRQSEGRGAIEETNCHSGLDPESRIVDFRREAPQYFSFSLCGRRRPEGPEEGATALKIQNDELDSGSSPE